jgi:hypothetical protein
LDGSLTAPSNTTPTTAAETTPLTRFEVDGRAHSSTSPGIKHKTNPTMIAGHDTNQPGARLGFGTGAWP